MLRNMFFSGRTVSTAADSYLLFITDVRDSLLTDRDLGVTALSLDVLVECFTAEPRWRN